MSTGIKGFGWRGLLAAMAMLLIVCSTPIILNALACHWVSDRLSEFAAGEIDAAARADAELRWSMSSLDELVAQRVFAATWFRADHEGLHVRGNNFEFGLRIPRGIDLSRYSGLTLTVGTGSQATSVESTSRKIKISARVLISEEINSRALISEPVELAVRTSSEKAVWRQWLGCLDWREAETGKSAPPPTRAAMLRLRFESSEAQTLNFGGVRLHGDPRFVPLDLSLGINRRAPAASDDMRIHGPTCPENEVDAQRMLRASTQGKRSVDVIEVPSAVADLDAFLQRPSTNAPIYQMPWFPRVESRLAWRDRVLDAQPNAILVPEESVNTIDVAARSAGNRIYPHHETSPWVVWSLVLSFAGFLLWVRTRRQRHDLVELGVVMLPMLVVVLTGGIGDNLPPPLLFLIASLALFVASFAREAKTALGRAGAPAEWQLAGLISMTVIAMLLVLHPQPDPLALPPMTVLARYAAWVVVQQMVLCLFVYERVLRLCRGNPLPATWLCALLFALLHTPNAGLMIATYVGALLWLPLYHRWRALPPIVAAHFITAVALQSLGPPTWVRSAEVSLRYLF